MIANVQFYRFLLAGVINTAFGFAVYACFVLLGAPVWLALLFSVVLGVAFNFISTGRFVFGNKSWRKFPRFVLSYAIVYWVNIFLLQLVIELVGNKIAAQLILCLPMAVLSYCILSLLVFPVRESRRLS